MARHLFVLTGASRGMGAAMARQLLAPENLLLCLSRRRNTALDTAGPGCEQWAIDLAQPVEAAARLAAWARRTGPERVCQRHADQQRAALTRIVRSRRAAMSSCRRRLRVGIEAPLLLSAAFLRATRSWAAFKRVLNISSGLGRRAMAGQASYCARRRAGPPDARARARRGTAPNGAKSCRSRPA